MPIEVDIDFQTNASDKFLIHKKAFVPFAGSKGKIQVNPNEFDLILFGIEGAPGSTATITLTPKPPATIEISGHPIKGKIPQGRIRWGDSRIFRVKP